MLRVGQSPRPPGPRLRRDSREIVNSIVQATALLAEEGIEGVTTNAIADRAGVGVASVYRYFPGKPALFAELSRRLHLLFLDDLRKVLATPELEVRDAIRASCALLVRCPHMSPALRRAMILEVPPAWTQQSADEVHAVALKEMHDWLSLRLSPTPDDLPQRLFASLGAVRGIVSMAIVHPAMAPSFDTLIELTFRVSCGCLLGDGASP